MIIEFIMGVSIFAHDVVIHQLWIEELRPAKTVVPKTIGTPLQYKKVLGYPSGFL